MATQTGSTFISESTTDILSKFQRQFWGLRHAELEKVSQIDCDNNRQPKIENSDMAAKTENT